ncbi:MAG: DUF1826 domain-containing protein [Sphingopyxis sp.]|nr:DUF1826 domain-containing protein [Sphingopyxis sp.]
MAVAAISPVCVSQHKDIVPADWAAVADADVPLVLEPRDASPFERAAVALLDSMNFALRAEGEVATIGTELADLPPVLRDDAVMLAKRFAALMDVDSVRVRVEAISGDACRKFHADYTDLRLITSWAGPGTDWLPPGASESAFERVPTGWVGLFKGHLFGDGHRPCIHRSPPIAGTGELRLVLVIDTPARVPNGQA